MSIQATKERNEDVARMERRKEEDRREAEVRVLELLQQVEEIKRTAAKKERMNDRNLEAVKKSHEENMRMLEEEDAKG